MARRKTTTRRRTGKTATKRRTTGRTTRKKKSNGLVNFFVPLFFIGCILICLGFLMFMGYQTVTASSFFDLEKVELEGVSNVPKERVAEIVKSHAVEKGVWKSDLDTIRTEIEKFKYAKEVSVSRILPDTVRVIVEERVPVALVRLDGKDFWVDKDGLILNLIKAEDDRPPFTMFGWSESTTEKDFEDNIERVKLYQTLLKDWESNDLAKRVKAIDLSDIRDPQAIVEDSGHTVRILLSNDKDYGKRLQKGIESIAGRGKEIKSVDVSGTNPIVSYRNS